MLPLVLERKRRRLQIVKSFFNLILRIQHSYGVHVVLQYALCTIECTHLVYIYLHVVCTDHVVFKVNANSFF